VYVDEATTRSSNANRMNAERLIREAVDLKVDLLSLEDDVNASSDFPDAVQAARRAETIVTFWLEKQWTHPIPWWQPIKGRMENVPPPGLHPVRKFPQSWYGAQAIYYPLARLRDLMNARDFGVPNGLPIDRWLRTVIPNIRVALPNPIQHRSPPTVIEHRKPRISPTFHMPRTGSWEDA